MVFGRKIISGIKTSNNVTLKLGSIGIQIQSLNFFSFKQTGGEASPRKIFSPRKLKLPLPWRTLKYLTPYKIVYPPGSYLATLQYLLWLRMDLRCFGKNTNCLSLLFPFYSSSFIILQQAVIVHYWCLIKYIWIWIFPQKINS